MYRDAVLGSMQLARCCAGALIVLAACGETFESDEPSANGKSIGPEGGTITSVDGTLTIVVPPGALAETLLVTIGSATDAPPSIGPAYRVTPNVDTAAPIVVAYRYDFGVIMDRNPKLLTIGRDIGDRWERLPRITLDEPTQQVAVQDSALSFAYGLLEDSSLDDTDTDAGTTLVEADDESDVTGSSTGDDTTSSDTSASDESDGGSPRCGDGIVDPGELCLAPSETIAVGTMPRALAAADLDGDGKKDLVVANGGSGDVSVLRGDAGGFAPAIAIPTGGTPAAIRIHDIDGGFPDIVLADETGGRILVLPGNGDGTFGDAIAYPVGNGVVDLALGDFDEDGIDDVVALNGGPDTLGLLLGDGTGLAPMQSYAVATNPVALAIADVNGDANLDVATVGATLGIVLGNGGALFGGPTLTPLGAAASSIASLDANGDGRIDLAITTPGLDAIEILFGNGVGGFAGGVPYPVGQGPADLVAADLDADGAIDLAAVSEGDDTLTILLGMGNGGFALADTRLVGMGPTAIVLVDLAGDGAPDLVVADTGGDTITLVRAQP